MKNDRTPRTTAECEFTTGYPRVPRKRSIDSEVVVGWICTLGIIAYALVMVFA